MKKILLAIAAILLFAEPAFAASPVTITDSAGNKATVSGGNLSVADAPLLAAVANTLNFTSTQTGGNTGTSGTFGTIANSSSTRHGCIVFNKSTDNILIFFGLLGSATTTAAFRILPNGYATCSVGNIVLTDAINITGEASNTDAYVLVLQ